MKFTKELIDELAAKLLIGLTDEENEMVLNEFENIEENMNLINEIADLSEIEPLTHPFPIDDVILRNDEDIEELSQEEALKNSECKKGDTIVVPKVVG